MVRRAVFLACAAGLRLAAPPHAQAAEERLQWDAPVGCPGVDGVRAAVASALGASDFDLGSFRSIRGRVERRSTEWQLSLELIDAERRRARVIVAPSCRDLVQAAGVAIALALDGAPAAEVPATDARAPEAQPTAHAVAASQAVEEPPSPAVSAPVAEQAASSARARASEPPRPVVGAAGLLDAAALRGIGWGVELSAGLALGALELRAYGFVLPEQRTARGSGAVQLQLLAGGVRARRVLSSGLLQASGYLALEAGRLSARGDGLADAHEFHDLWLAPELGVLVGRDLGGGLALTARAGALTPLLREKYAVDDRLVHRPELLGWRAALGLTWRWQ